MKLCKDCKHHNKLRFEGLNGNPDKRPSVCTLKTEPKTRDYVTGDTHYRIDHITECNDERKESKGLFGYFIDETRCGPEAKNFEAKGD